MMAYLPLSLSLHRLQKKSSSTNKKKKPRTGEEESIPQCPTCQLT